MSSIWDRISGKDELKEKLEELENEVECLASEKQEKQSEIKSLKDRVGRLEEKKKKEVRKKQDAFEARNRLQDKVSQLEDKISKETEEDNEKYGKQVNTVTKGQSEELFRTISEVEFKQNRAFSAYTSGSKGIGGLEKFPDDIVEVVYGYRPSLVYLDSFGLTNFILEPPLKPQEFSRWDNKFRINKDWFIPNGEYIICVVRSNTFALGKFSNGNMAEYSGFESRVKSNHSKGGFSQSRFERIRDEQIDEHIRKCKKEINSYEVSTKIVLGSKGMVSRFENICDIKGRTDAKGKSRSTVQKADNNFWKTKIISF